MLIVLLSRKGHFYWLALSLFYSQLVHAEPWYAGPILSDPAVVTPIGHGFFQIHTYKTSNYGVYDIDYVFEPLPYATTGEIDLTLNYGITSNTEFQIFLTYLDNATEGQKSSNLGDTMLTIATQLTLQNDKKWPPNIKLFYRQLFPTGRYDNLNGNLLGTDATGQGSYLSSLAMNMEHVSEIFPGKYLVGFATVTFTYAPKIRLNSYNIYGGGEDTSGSMWPGNSMAFNLAFEYCPSQHWGFILESYIYSQKASKFDGDSGTVTERFNYSSILRHRRFAGIIFNRLRPSSLNFGSEDYIGHGNIALFSFAPAVDYSFTKNVSLTMGCWFSAAGKHSPAFYSPMVVFTAN